VTECPYCGTRLRKRAPKLDKRLQRVSRGHRMPTPSLGRLRRGEIPGIRADQPPYATWLIVLATCGVWVAARAGYLDRRPAWSRLAPLPATGGMSSRRLRVLGSGRKPLLEPRRGRLPVHDACCRGAVRVAARAPAWLARRACRVHDRRVGRRLPRLELKANTVAVGGNGGALALLCAWAVPDMLGAAPATPTTATCSCGGHRLGVARDADRTLRGERARWRLRRRLGLPRRAHAASALSAARRAARDATYHPLRDRQTIAGASRSRTYTAEEVDAAVSRLGDPERVKHASEIVTHAAPSLAGVLDAALAEEAGSGRLTRICCAVRATRPIPTSASPPSVPSSTSRHGLACLSASPSASSSPAS